MQAKHRQLAEELLARVDDRSDAPHNDTHRLVHGTLSNARAPLMLRCIATIGDIEIVDERLINVKGVLQRL